MTREAEIRLRELAEEWMMRHSAWHESITGKWTEFNCCPIGCCVPCRRHNPFLFHLFMFDSEERPLPADTDPERGPLSDDECSHKRRS